MKIQPNFSWQKYEGKPADEKEQFYYQLQRQFILIANSINTTIDDASYWPMNRNTAFAWIDKTLISEITISGLIVGSASTAFPHGLTNISTVVELRGTFQNTIPLTATANPLPYIDPNTLLNSVGLLMDTTNIYIVAGNGLFNGFPFSVTIFYTQIRG